jgi:glucose/arabinose dehydrogenase
LVIIILSVILINIATGYQHYHFGQADGYVDRGLRSLYDAVINEGGNVDFASLVSSNQDNIILSERFEGPIKIIGNAPVRTVPTLNDPDLSIDTVITGLEFPTSMAFLGADDILVLEKNKGTLRKIVNGNLLPDPLLDVNVGTLNDRGMLGIALGKDKGANSNVFVYFTETGTKDGSDTIEYVTNKNHTYETTEPLANRLYRYKLINDSLTSPKLLIDIPAKAAGEKNIGIHNGGKVIIGPDDNVYLIVGDIGGFKTKTQNFANKNPLNATSVILRISQEGEAIHDIIGSKDPINKFYAYGIRNSFGMDFDPVTGNLWDTENGPTSNDEINLVKPRFNSGWREIMGMAPNENDLDLVEFGGKGRYSNPEFVWLNNSVAPTALKFLNSGKLGKQYKNDMFVGDFNNGTLYHFDLNDKRTNLILNGPLEDRIANSSAELQDIIFGTGFGSITDIQVGPDGFLYVISIFDSIGTPYPYNENARGTIFRIRPAFADVS